ncbi:hypothetical protein ACJMK2_020604 [Sinanodonta woodiana]|uniref:Uncharacterized protein n=1 Tax=Sinanodonta woodiana TaxID=1069815 RepID=A0ABD3U1B7_SINWO
MQKVGTPTTKTGSTNITPSQKEKLEIKSRLYSTPELKQLAIETAKLDPLSPIFFNLHNTTFQNDDMDATLTIGVYTTGINTLPTNSPQQISNIIGPTIPTLTD